MRAIGWQAGVAGATLALGALVALPGADAQGAVPAPPTRAGARSASPAVVGADGRLQDVVTGWQVRRVEVGRYQLSVDGPAPGQPTLVAWDEVATAHLVPTGDGVTEITFTAQGTAVDTRFVLIVG